MSRLRWLGLLLAGYGLVSVCQACSCVDDGSGPCGRAKSDTIFRSKVVAGAIRGSAVSFTFEIVESFRGVSPGRVEVTTAADEGMCGYTFQVGREYLVYAHRDKESLYTGSCSGNQPIGQASEDLRYLRQMGARLEEGRTLPGYVFGGSPTGKKTAHPIRLGRRMERQFAPGVTVESKLGQPPDPLREI
jgi:hypothetical protein